MEFTLYYRGPLKSNGRPSEKHAIREHFHSQLKHLWTETQLVHYRRLLDLDVGDACLIRAHHGFKFAPLVAESVGLVAEVDLLMLWPSEPGCIITSGGDIDNRLKTLFDSLKVPREPNALPGAAAPTPDQDPFYCLLEDDSLITRVNIETARLLEPTATTSEVVLTIRVRTKQTRSDLALHPLIAGLG